MSAKLPNGLDRIVHTGRFWTPALTAQINDRLGRCLVDVSGRHGVLFRIPAPGHFHLVYDWEVDTNNPYPPECYRNPNLPHCPPRPPTPCLNPPCDPPCDDPPCDPPCQHPPCDDPPPCSWRILSGDCRCWDGSVSPSPGDCPDCPDGSRPDANGQCNPSCFRGSDCTNGTSFGIFKVYNGAIGDVVLSNNTCYVLESSVPCLGATVPQSVSGCDDPACASSDPCADCNGAQPVPVVTTDMTPVCSKDAGLTCADCFATDPADAPYAWNNYSTAADQCIWTWGTLVDDFNITVTYHITAQVYDVELNDFAGSPIYSVFGITGISCVGTDLAGTVTLAPQHPCLLIGGNCQEFTDCPDAVITFG